ncbi:MAG: energy-coupled thiamine transporter ThiT [Candidatus Coproplasma sp.]
MFSTSLLASYFDRIKYPDENGEKYYLYESVWADYAKSSLSTTFFYVAIALAVILIGIGIFVRLKRSESFGAYVKTAATVAVTFAITVIIAMVAIGFGKISEKGYWADQAIEIVPPIVLAVVAVLGIIASYVSSFFSKKAYKITLITSISLIGAALVATLVCMGIYFANIVAGDGYYDSDEYGKLNQIGLYVSAGVLIVAAVAAAILLDLKNDKPFDSRCIALAGITVALSFALSYIKFFELPQGGSITLASLLPVMLFAYVYGTKKGLLVGFIYGILQAIQDPYIIHPAQFLLDYPIAFAMVGFAGAFKKIKALDKLPQIQFALGAILAGCLRFLAHLFSGVFAFGAYAVDAGQQNFWLYSAAYNSFVFADLVLVVVAGVLLFSSKSFIKSINRYVVKKTTATQTDAVAEAAPADDTAE